MTSLSLGTLQIALTADATQLNQQLNAAKDLSLKAANDIEASFTNAFNNGFNSISQKLNSLNFQGLQTGINNALNSGLNNYNFDPSNLTSTLQKAIQAGFDKNQISGLIKEINNGLNQGINLNGIFQKAISSGINPSQFQKLGQDISKAIASGASPEEALQKFKNLSATLQRASAASFNKNQLGNLEQQINAGLGQGIDLNGHFQKAISAGINPSQFQKFGKELSKAIASGVNPEEVFKKYTNNIGSSLSGISSQIQGVFSGISSGFGIGIFNGITGAIQSAIGAVQQFSGSVFGVIKDFQGFEASLKTFLKGNQAEVDSFVNGLTKFAATTPFQLKDLQQAAIQNLATGAKPDQILADLKKVGDVAAGSKSDINDLMRVYAQARSMGKLQGGELNEFQYKGIPIKQQLATEEEVTKLAESGELKFSHLEEAFKNMTGEGGLYFDGMKNKMGTLEGKISNIQDTFYQFQKQLGEALLPLFNVAVDFVGQLSSGLTDNKDLMGELNKQASDLTNYFKQNPEIAKSLSEALNELVRGAMAGLVSGAKSLGQYLKENPRAIQDAVGAAIQLGQQIGGMVQGVGQLVSGVMQFVDGLKQAAIAIRDGIGNSLKGVTDMFGDERAGDDKFKDFLYGKNAPGFMQGLGKILGYKAEQGAYEVTSDGQQTSDVHQVIAHHGGKNYYQKEFEGKEETFRNDGGTERLIKDIVLSKDGREDVNVPSAGVGTARVKSEAESGGYGNLVEILNDAGDVIARMAHLSSVAVQTGQQIAFGQTVGVQGNTGNSSGTHLHVEMQKELLDTYYNDLKSGGFETTQAICAICGATNHSTSTHQNTANAAFGNLQAQATNGVKRGGNDLTPEEMSKLTPEGKQLYELRNNPGILAAADSVARAEGSDFRPESKNYGYDTTVDDHHIGMGNLQTHPFVGTGRSPIAGSTASGRYQMMDFNWDAGAAQKQFGDSNYDLKEVFQGSQAPTFSPAVQDLYFILSLKRRGVLDAALQGDFNSVFGVHGNSAPLSKHYASLENQNGQSYYSSQGTPEGMRSQTIPFAQQRLQTYLSGGGQSSATPTTPQFSDREMEMMGKGFTMTRGGHSYKIENGNVTEVGLNSSANNIAKMNLSSDSSGSLTSTSLTGGTATAKTQTPEDLRALEKIRRQESEKIATDIKQELDAATEVRDTRTKLKREQESKQRKTDADNQKAKLELLKADAPDSESKTAVQYKIDSGEMERKQNEDNITYKNQREDLVLARDKKLKIESELKKRDKERADLAKKRNEIYTPIDINKALGKDAGNDYSKAIDLLDKDHNKTLDTQKLEKKALDTNYGKNLDKQSLDQQRTTSEKELERQDKTVVNNLKIELQRAQARGDEQLALKIQLKLDTTDILQNVDKSILPLKNKLEDLSKQKAFLIKVGYKVDSPEVKLVSSQIVKLNKEISQIKNQGDIDIKIKMFDTDKKLDLAAIEQRVKLLTRQQEFPTTDAQILNLNANLIKNTGGDEYKASKLEKEASTIQENNRYRSEMLEIEKKIAEARGTSQEYSQIEQAALKQNAEDIHKINLLDISQQTKTLSKDMTDASKGGIKTFFNDIISGTKTINNSFRDLISGILNQLTQLVTNQIFASIFGGKGLQPNVFPSGGAGSIFGNNSGIFGISQGNNSGGLFSLFGSAIGGSGGSFGGSALSSLGSVLGFADGTTEVKSTDQSWLKTNGALTKALTKETAMSGRPSIIAALSEGELVLSNKQSEKFRSLGLDKVVNYASGNLDKFSMAQPLGATNNVHLGDIKVDGAGSSGDVDWKKVQSMAAVAAQQEIIKQQRPNGILNQRYGY